MPSLTGKNIVLAITGSIAAYKSALLVRLLVKAGADVQVVMTPASHDFITPLTLATLAKHPVKSDFTEEKESGEWTNHVELGMWADLMIVAPASANTLAKMSNGVCDNFLLAVYLSAKCPVMVAPAMDLDMYAHPTTTENLSKLRQQGVTVIDASSGELASGLEGKGRMAEPEDILYQVEEFFHGKKALTGKKALVTAGPTFEPIDPVRFVGNRSSGKMGYRIADALSEAGAQVTLVSGPSHEKVERDDIEIIRVETAGEMFQACQALWPAMDIGVFSAAVADYRPSQSADQKIKKSKDHLVIDMEKTTDILGTLAAQKEHQYVVGFALETQNAEQYGKEKLERKNLDMIVVNSLADEGAGFGHETNKVTFLLANNKIHRFELKSKAAVAADLVKTIIEETK